MHSMPQYAGNVPTMNAASKNLLTRRDGVGLHEVSSSREWPCLQPESAWRALDRRNVSTSSDAGNVNRVSMCGVRPSSTKRIIALEKMHAERMERRGRLFWSTTCKEHARSKKQFTFGMLRGLEDEKPRGHTQRQCATTPISVSNPPHSSDVSNSEEVAKSSAEVKTRRKRRGGVTISKEEAWDEELEKGFKMSQVCDRLVEVFLTEKTSAQERRALLALSQEWVKIRPQFFKRCKEKSRAETDRTRKKELTKMAGQIKEINELMTQHDKLLSEVETREFEFDVVIAKRRKDFTSEFFEHLQTLCHVSPRSKRRDEVASVAGKCLSLVQAYDAALEDPEIVGEAQHKLDDILNSGSLDDASNKIATLARSKELDSTLLLLITRTWAEARDSPRVAQEVKDILHHLYDVAKTSTLKLVPDEILIIKYLLSIPDPRDRFAAMAQAFAPGDDLEEKNAMSSLHTKPDKLRYWIKLVLDAYYTNKQSELIKDAENLTNPQVISRLEMLLEFMNDQFV